MYNIIIIGGDKRQLYLNEYLTEKGFFPFCYGLSGKSCPEKLEYELEKSPVAVILPLPVSRDAKHINFALTDEILPLSFISGRMKKGDIVLGGILKDDFKKELSYNDVDIVDFYDEDFILKNAYLTGICTVRIVLENIDYDIARTRIGITGYGRTGKEISLALRSVGADITVMARSDKALFDSGIDGFKTLRLSGLADAAEGFDIIVNTVPSQIITEDVIKRLKKSALLIEIASAPFGIDFDAAKRHSIRTVKALSLPGKFVPKSAGELIGEKIIKFF